VKYSEYQKLRIAPMYVSNEERMRLGIQRYGSDVPVAEYEKAKAAKDGVVKKVVEEVKEEEEDDSVEEG
tara:strand:+ start:969 stop:1175 length:207 start_codon:yes stop_codon:yes gene_type:complete